MQLQFEFLYFEVHALDLNMELNMDETKYTWTTYTWN